MFGDGIGLRVCVMLRIYRCRVGLFFSLDIVFLGERNHIDVVKVCIVTVKVCFKHLFKIK